MKRQFVSSHPKQNLITTGYYGCRGYLADTCYLTSFVLPAVYVKTFKFSSNACSMPFLRCTFGLYAYFVPVLVGPCHHGMARPQVADRGTASDKEGSCE